MQYQLNITTALLLAVFGGIESSAQEQEEESANVEVLQPFVVVATRTPISLAEASPSVSVVTSEELGEKQLRTLAGALRGLPGMFLGQSGQAGANASLFTRGSESNHTLFLLNGRRINPGFSGQFNLAQLGIDNVDRIEVMRGAATTLYGSESIGGVIDINLGGSGNTQRLSAEAGSFGSYLVSLGLAAENEKSGFSLTLSQFETDNQTPHADYRVFNWAPSLFYRINDRILLDFQGLYYESTNGLPGARVDFGFPKAEDFQENAYWMASPGIRIDVSDTFSARLFYSHSRDKLRSLTTGFFTSFNDFEVATDEVSLQIDWQAGDNFLATLGYTYLNNDFGRLDAGSLAVLVDNSSNSQSVFGQIQWRWHERFFFVAGVRQDEFSDFGSPVTWSISGAFDMPSTQTSFFIKAATAYAPPQGNDLYGPFGNPLLDAEESDSWEFGFRQTLLEEKLSVEVLYFYNDIFNRIIFDAVSFTTNNSGRMRTEGVEVSGDWNWNENLHIYGNFTFMNADDLTAGERLLRRPRYTFTAGFSSSPMKALDFGFEVSGASQREDRSFPPNPPFVVDVDPGDYVTGRIYANWQVSENLSLFGRIENLFNEQYDSFADFKALDRGVFGGATLTF